MRKLENKKLDEIGKLLVKAGTMPSREIDEIVGNRDLFESVKKRIAAGTEIPGARRSRLLIPGLATFASVALIAVVGLAFLRSGPVTPAETVKSVPTVSKAPGEYAKHNKPDGAGKLAEPVQDNVVEPAAIKPIKASHRQASRTHRPKQPVAQQARFVDDFYAVSYAGDPHETERGGRIVRVDIPRSTLFAMGINVPLENESATVKADLLIGSDGVTRAIRVVE